MSLYDFFNACLFDKLRLGEDYIVKIKCRYNATGEEYISNEILLSDDEGFEWVNDWWEGQDYIECMGYINVNNIKVPPVTDSIL